MNTDLVITRKYDKTRKRNIFFNTKTRKFVPKDTSLGIHLNSIYIPPAYTQVKISDDMEAKVQAIGVDSKGRNQYIYNKVYTEEQNEIKFKELIEFGRKIKKIRKDFIDTISNCSGGSIDKVLSKECQISLILFLIDKCNFRIGSEKYKDLYSSYGITTINSEHVLLNKNNIKIIFNGKKGVKNSSLVSNGHAVKLMRLLRQVNENREYLFTYVNNKEFYRVTEKHINTYLKSYHHSISVKMFRTWNANYMLLKELMKLPKPDNASQAKKNIQSAIQKAAFCMHHTKSVSKKSYMNNEIIDLYLNETDKFYDILSKFRKSNGTMPSVDRTLNLFLKFIN
jgi:DNA topoisomerase-1